MLSMERDRDRGREPSGLDILRGRSSEDVSRVLDRLGKTTRRIVAKVGADSPAGEAVLADPRSPELAGLLDPSDHAAIQAACRELDGAKAVDTAARRLDPADPGTAKAYAEAECGRMEASARGDASLAARALSRIDPAAGAAMSGWVSDRALLALLDRDHSAPMAIACGMAMEVPPPSPSATAARVGASVKEAFAKLPADVWTAGFDELKSKVPGAFSDIREGPPDGGAFDEAVAAARSLGIKVEVGRPSAGEAVYSGTMDSITVKPEGGIDGLSSEWGAIGPALRRAETVWHEIGHAMASRSGHSTEGGAFTAGAALMAASAAAMGLSMAGGPAMLPVMGGVAFAAGAALSGFGLKGQGRATVVEEASAQLFANMAMASMGRCIGATPSTVEYVVRQLAKLPPAERKAAFDEALAVAGERLSSMRARPVGRRRGIVGKAFALLGMGRKVDLSSADLSPTDFKAMKPSDPVAVASNLRKGMEAASGHGARHVLSKTEGTGDPIREKVAAVLRSSETRLAASSKVAELAAKVMSRIR